MSKSRNKLQLVLLYLAGYGYFFLLILGILGLFAFSIYLILSNNRMGTKIFKLAIPSFVILVALLRGLFSAFAVKIPAPEGIDIKKEEFPELYNLAEEIRTRLKCPNIHYIKLDLCFNAYIAEIPTCGILGIFKRYLVIGIPMMLALSKDELRAVIGHELGHLSRAHVKKNVKILRVEDVWRKAAEELKKSGRDRNRLFRAFLIRYIPALNDALLSLRRQNEYEADKASEFVTDSATAAEALVKFPLYDSYLRNVFWDRINALAEAEENPPQMIFHLMEKFLDEPFPEEPAKNILSQVLKIKSLPCWTHPSTGERLSNLGARHEFPKHRKTSALRDILGDRADAVLSKANLLWISEVSETWNNIYKSCEKSRQRLKELEEKKKHTGALSPEEEIELALLLEKVEGTERALEAVKALYDAKPDDLYVAYHLGRLMLECGDPEGQDILHEVMETEVQLIPYCCNVLYRYHRSEGSIEEARKYYYYATEFMKTNEDIKNERDTVQITQAYLPHDLDMKTVENLRNKLLEKGYVKRAYIAIKEDKSSGQFPVYIILVKTKAALREITNIRTHELAADELIPWDYFIVPIRGKNRELEYKFISLENSRIV